MTKEISEFFDIEHESDEPNDEQPLEPIVHSDSVLKNIKDDYHVARESMRSMIEKGTGLIDKLAKVAEESESPRAFEVMAGYLKTMTEMNKMLIEMHKDVKEATEERAKEKEEEEGGFTYIGSTEELQRYLEGKTNGKKG